VLLIGLSTGLLVARRTSEALKAQRQVDRLLEESLETLRAGELPVRSGPLPIDHGAGVDFPVALHLEVSPQGLGGLDLVVVRATYLRQGDPVERRLASQIWSPR